jgi:hypothetical protein
MFAVKKPYIENAIEALLNKEPDPGFTAIGCSIKETTKQNL